MMKRRRYEEPAEEIRLGDVLEPCARNDWQKSDDAGQGQTQVYAPYQQGGGTQIYEPVSQAETPFAYEPAPTAYAAPQGNEGMDPEAYFGRYDEQPADDLQQPYAQKQSFYPQPHPQEEPQVYLSDEEEIYSDEHEAADHDGRFRIAMGMFDLVSILVGIAVILLLVAMLFTLVNWLRTDVTHSALLLQSGLK